MTLIIQKPTTSKLILAKNYVGIDDPDAAVYIAAVEAADETASPGVGALETATKVAIHSFVKGCKNDGIWPAIKASCILAGARTLNGALVPLVGTAPTNVNNNFVSGDYNRKNGLTGDGSTKYLNSNRATNADPQNTKHLSVYMTTHYTRSGTQGVIGSSAGGASLLTTATTRFFRISAGTGGGVAEGTALPGLFGASRSDAANVSGRYNSTDYSVALASEALASNTSLVFTRDGTTLVAPTIAFYSIGGAIDLAKLDTRVTDLINAFAAAIP